MTETDVEYPQPNGQVEGLDGLVDGIVDLLDNADPNSSGVASSMKPVAETEVAEQEETEDGEVEDPGEPEKYVIKWQGQDREVTQSELLDFAQKGFDYTQKTQSLAEERNRLAPYEGLANLIKSDPVKANQIAAILAGSTPLAQPEKEKKTFDDPIEQLKWETKQEALEEFRKEMRASVLPLHRQQVLNQVKQQVQADPEYQVIHQQILDMVKDQPPALQKNMFLQLDQDPASYMEAFQFFKNKRVQKQSTDPPKPVKKETHAPILETGGVSAPDGIEGKVRAERITKQKAKALRSGDPSAIASWLGDSGALDHLY